MTAVLLALSVLACATAASGIAEPSFKASCPLSEAHVEGTVMVIDDVTTVPGCEEQDPNKFGVFASAGPDIVRYYDSSSISPTTAAGPGCVHEVSFSGVDLGVTCAGVTQIVVLARSGADRASAIDFSGTGPPVTIVGGAGDDRLSAVGRGAAISGGSGKDLVTGGKFDDTLDGGPGRDYISGSNGDDRLSGGQGNDTLAAGSDDDVLRGGPGADFLKGAQDADTLLARDGRRDNLIECGKGNDPAPRVDPGLDPKPHNC